MFLRGHQPLKRSRLPRLPQEITDLIIEQIASEYQEDASLLETLQACALASSSLRIASLKYAFSEVCLLVDRLTQRRAKKLFKVLDPNGNPWSPLRHIRSLELVVEPLRVPPGIMFSMRPGYYLYSWKKTIEENLHRLAERLRVWENYLLKVLELFAQSPTLERLVLRSENANLSWSRINDSIRSTLYKIRCGSSIKSLHLIGIRHLDQSFIAGKESTVQIYELTLQNVKMRSEVPIPFFVTPFNGLQHIEKLDVSSNPDFFSLFPSSPLPPEMLTRSLPKLKSLALSLYGSHATPCVIWESVCCFSTTLQSLEIRDVFFNDAKHCKL